MSEEYVILKTICFDLFTEYKHSESKHNGGKVEIRLNKYWRQLGNLRRKFYYYLENYCWRSPLGWHPLGVIPENLENIMEELNKPFEGSERRAIIVIDIKVPKKAVAQFISDYLIQIIEKKQNTENPKRLKKLEKIEKILWMLKEKYMR